MEYIAKQDAVNVIDSLIVTCGTPSGDSNLWWGVRNDALVVAKEKIENLSPADVITNDRGHWLDYELDEDGNVLAWICPNCDEVVDTKWKYCPMCGDRKCGING